jgi:transcriptional regulator with XRE-family HTH domain
MNRIQEVLKTKSLKQFQLAEAIGVTKYMLANGVAIQFSHFWEN